MDCAGDAFTETEFPCRHGDGLLSHTRRREEDEGGVAAHTAGGCGGWWGQTAVHCLQMLMDVTKQREQRNAHG